MSIVGQQWAGASASTLWGRRGHPDDAVSHDDFDDVTLVLNRVSGNGETGLARRGTGLIATPLSASPSYSTSPPRHHYAYGQSNPSLRPGLAR